MLSILIPVYNFDVQQLVLDLLEQGRLLSIPFEIRVYDDASPGAEKLLNRSISSHVEVVYQELNVNLGRSAIRNRLAADAIYDYLLFLDGDSAVVNTQFLKNYLKYAKADTVLHGGTAYRKTPPDDERAYLRWYYGTHREVRSPIERTASGYHGFTSNNFFIPKRIFDKVHFDESIDGYGHEDTLFGFALAEKHIKISYIDNPLGHIGLESGKVFLQKTRDGVRNLKRLHQEGKPVKAKLLSTYLCLEKWRIKWIFTALEVTLPLIEKNLLGQKPKLWVFDLYKLIWMIKQ